MSDTNNYSSASDNADQHVPPEANATVEHGLTHDQAEAAETPPKAQQDAAAASAGTGDQEAPDSVSAVVENYAADAEKDAKNAIIDLSNAIHSADTTSGQVKKAESQSPEMQTGAQVAHDNAVQVLFKRFKTVVDHFGEEVAADIRHDLALLHDAEQVVAKTFKTAGA